MAANVLIMAGGTGGHVFPALACAREFQARGYAVHWLGTPRGIENELVPAAGLPLHLIQVSGLRGKGVKSLLKRRSTSSVPCCRPAVSSASCSRSACSAWAATSLVRAASPHAWPACR